MNKDEVQKKIDAALLKGEPRQILIGSPKKYARGKDTPRWWVELKCSEHGRYPVPKRLDNAIASTKRIRRCPQCSIDRASYENTIRAATENGSLEELFPEIAREWHPTKNKFKPSQVPVKSNLNVWWICPRGHEFNQRIADRTTKLTSCTICQKHLRVSKFELYTFSVLFEIFNGNVRSQYSGPLYSKDIDIYVPELNLAIEVDGYPWHLKTQKRDKKKQDEIISDDFNLLRFRDYRLPKVHDFELRENLTLENTQSVIELVNYLRANFQLKGDQEARAKEFVVKQKLGLDTFHSLMAEFPLPSIKDEKKLVDPVSVTHPHLEKEWGDNGLLTPEMVSKGQHLKVEWICQSCGDKYVKSVKERCDQTYGCKSCADSKKNLTRHEQRRKQGINLADQFPKLAQQFNDKRNKCSAKDIGPGDGRRFWWTCPDCKMDFDASPHSRTSKGDNCPYCSGHRACHWNNLKALYPDIDQYWDYSNNGEKLPENYTSGSAEMIRWRCPKCGASRLGRINDRVDRKNKKVRRFKHKCI